MFGAWAALVGLAGARVRRRAGALLAVALGVAAAASAVLAATPLSLVSRQSAMERSLRALAPAERAVRVTVVRERGGTAGVDATVRDGLRGSVFAPGVAQAVRFGGRSAGRLGSVVLTGIDSPRRWITLSSGRLPRACSPAACEVVAVGGGRRLPLAFSLEGMRMRVVGRGRLDGVPLGAVPPGSGSVDSASAFVVAAGVDALAGLRPLRRVVRTFAWARVLDPAAVHPWTADRLLDELLDTRTQLLSSLSSAEVRGPSERIAAEQARGRASGAFALVIAGLAATVLLAFAAFAAAEQHADVAAELSRLRAMAARRRHLAALVLAEAAVPALFGVLAGFGLAALAGVVAAGWAGVPAGPVLREGLFSSGQITAAVVLWAAAVLVVAGVLGGAQSRTVRIALEAGCAVVIGRRVTLGSLREWESSSNRGDFANGVFSYSIDWITGYLAVRAPQPAAPSAVRVLATPGLARLAGAHGRLPLRMSGADLLPVDVVGVVKHVPTTGRGEAVVADVGRLFAALNAQYPGLGTISERWSVGSRAPGAGRELRLDALARQAAADPLSRGVLRGLWGLALLGGLVALAAVALAVASATRDRGGEQAELEALGVPPRSLRAQMVATAAITATAGLLAGVCGGAALASAFTGLVALGADGRSPLPDLIPAFPWPLALTLAVTAAAIATAAASVQARRAFRGDALGRLRG